MNIYTQNYSQGSNTAPPGTPNSSTVQPGAPTSFPSPDDPASNVNRPVPGWPTLAKLIAQNPDLEAFPSFTDLAAKSLLYYQAELISLRKHLHKLEWADYRTSDDEVPSSFADNLSFLIRARDEAIENQTALPLQWIVMEKIRTTLDEYSQLLHTLERARLTNYLIKILHSCNSQRYRHS